MGVPAARRTRSSALASKASRSTTIRGVASGSGCAATASLSRAQSRLRSRVPDAGFTSRRSRDAALAQQGLDLGHLGIDVGQHRLLLGALALRERLALGL